MAYAFSGPVGFDEQERRFTHACPACAGDIDTLAALAPSGPDGARRLLLLAWCEDCKDVVGHALGSRSEA